MREGFIAVLTFIMSFQLLMVSLAESKAFKLKFSHIFSPGKVHCPAAEPDCLPDTDRGVSLRPLTPRPSLRPRLAQE